MAASSPFASCHSVLRTRVVRFAADFVLDCGSASGPLLTGSLQYNSRIDVPTTTLSVDPGLASFCLAPQRDERHSAAVTANGSIDPEPSRRRVDGARQSAHGFSYLRSSGTGSATMTVALNVLGGHPGTGSATGSVTVTLTDGSETSKKSMSS